MGGNYTLAMKEISTLSILGENDNEIFQHASAKSPSGFKGYFDEYSHNEKHTYPTLTEQLQAKINASLQFSRVNSRRDKSLYLEKSDD